jgi:TRAP-type C4-dicarboxylate transport system permease small subunit
MDHDKKDGAGGTAYDVILERIQALSNVLMVILLIGLTLLLGASISMRYFIGQPISWANAISRYAYIYIVLIGSAVSYMLEGHATIESFYNLMPRGIKLVCDLAHCLIIMGLSAILVVKGTKYAISMWGVHSPVLTFFSMGIVYLSVPISFLIIFLYMLKKAMGLPLIYRE